MCIICLSVDFITQVKTSKWIDTTQWWASVLGFVLVHYMDGTHWNENSSQLSKHPCHRIHGPGVLDQFNIRSDDFLLVLFSADLAGVFWFSCQSFSWMASVYVKLCMASVRMASVPSSITVIAPRLLVSE